MIARIAALALATLLGTAASQMPEFVQQYRQRLGGAIDELRAIVADFDASAAREGLGRAAAIERLQANPDPLAADAGLRIRTVVARLDRLAAHRDKLAQAGPFARLLVFAGDADVPLARATAADFEPAVPVTAEGAASAGVGFIAGLAIWRLLAGGARLARRRQLKMRRGA